MTRQSSRSVDKFNYLWLKEHENDPKVPGTLPAIPTPPVTAQLAADESLCVFCRRPVGGHGVFAEFAYAKTTPANRGLCKRSDCKKARRADSKSNGVEDFDKDEDEYIEAEEGDAVDELNQVRMVVENVSTDAATDENTRYEEEKDVRDLVPTEPEIETPADSKDEFVVVSAEDEPDKPSDVSFDGPPKPADKIFADGLFPVPYDFTDDETPLLARVRAGYRPPKDLPTILLPGSTFAPIRRCSKHGVDSCTICFAPSELVKAFEMQKAKLHELLERESVSQPSSLENSVAQILEKKRLAKLAAHPPKENRAYRQEQMEKWMKRGYDKYSLRRLCGYGVRQLADLFNTSRFNPKNSVFTPGQVDYYRDYALGKITKEELETRVRDCFYGRKGFERPDYLKRLEDDLVNRAWKTGLLEMTPIVIPGAESDDDPFAPATDVEDGLIGRGGSDLAILTGKAKYTGGKTGATYGLWSFDDRGCTKTG